MHLQESQRPAWISRASAALIQVQKVSLIQAAALIEVASIKSRSIKALIPRVVQARSRYLPAYMWHPRVTRQRVILKAYLYAQLLALLNVSLASM